MAEDAAVKVCVRVRPLIEREENAASDSQLPKLYWKTDKKTVHQADDVGSVKSFSFDRVFTADETTNQLYQTIAKPLVVSTVQGYNGTIFAYGQTSSGKTFTMMGSDRTPGVIPLAVEDVFQTINNFPNKEFLLRVSYMEIYNETVSDLLVNSWKRKPLEVREGLNKNIYVADLTEEVVTSPAQALHWIKLGEKNRHYGKTKMNQRSSRSHTIFRMILESRERSDCENAIIVSHLNLVDLAGSERASQTGAEGARFKEGCNINRSLFTLGQVIKKLTDEGQKGFTNYRDSKLTRILQNSLGGNAKTVIICTITPVTFDETLSTLQFASTAKKMKNDPHVTEVSDDGALLKRYRNEIEALKRQLHEVTSVTQTTVTQKELLSQLLQENDQLQREQEDRIKNLTNLLVSASSNQIAVRQVPKRRVTWGGKMLKLAACSNTASEASFVESSTRKRKANRSCIEPDDDDFYTHWEIPEEPPEDLDTSQVSITIRSFGDSPKEYMLPDHLNELSGKVASLEQQLEMERSQKSEIESKFKIIDDRVAELELELQMEVQLKKDASDKLIVAQQQEAELDLQLKAKLEENLQLEENKMILMARLADLEKQLQEPAQSDDTDQMQQRCVEAIQLCETLAEEKDLLFSERDYLKQELGMSHEHIKKLEKENEILQQELKEKREIDEFETLEEQFGKGKEEELHQEILQLKMAVDSSERKSQDLQKNLEALTLELKEKSDLIEDLQRMNGKDLVQEVAMLQRSVDDAEKVSRDTKKEWAFLRSQNITLEEKNAMLSIDNEKKDKEVGSLRAQLECEKSKFKKMQVDLQKELNIAFEENSKFMTLLDGKVPKNMIDNIDLERTVVKLKDELAAYQATNAELCVKVEELQELPVKVSELKKQLEESECVQVSLTLEMHEVQKLKKDLEEKLADSEEARRTDEDIHKEIEEQLNELTAELQKVQSDKEAAMLELECRLKSVSNERDALQQRIDMNQSLVQSLQEELQEKRKQQPNEEELHQKRVAELEQQINIVSKELVTQRQEKEENISLVTCLREERDQLKVDLQENIEMMIEVQDELRISQEKNIKQKQRIEELQNAQMAQVFSPAQLEELQAQTKTLREELQREQADRRSTAQEVDELLSRVNSLTEDREQLQQVLDTVTQEKEQLQQQLDNRTDMVSLHSELDQAETQENLTKLHQEIEQLQASLQTVSEAKSQLESELQENKQKTETLREELQREQADRRSSTQEVEELLSRVNSLTEDREQLQQVLDTVTQEKEQLQQLLDNRTDMVSLHSELDQAETQENLIKHQQEIEQLQASLQTVSEAKSQLESELQENKQKLHETQRKLQSLEQMLQEQSERNTDLERLSRDKEAEIERETKTLREELQREQADRQSSTQEVDELLSRVNSLTEDREQLQQVLDTVTQEKEQLQQQLDNRMDMVSLHSELNQAETQENLTKHQQEIEQLQASLQTVSEAKSQLERELQENMQKLDETQRNLQSLEQMLQEQNERNTELERLSRDKQAELERETKTLREELQSEQADRQSSTQEVDKLLSRVNSLTEDREQLQQVLDTVTQEKEQLQELLDNRMDMLQTEKCQVNASLHMVTEEKGRIEKELQNNMEMLQSMSARLQSAETDRQSSAQEIDKLLSRVSSLTEDREQLQEALNTVTQEKAQLQQQLDQAVEKVEPLKKELSIRQKNEAEAQVLQQLLSEANQTISSLREQLSSPQGDSPLSLLLDDSSLHLQESLKRFKRFADVCSTHTCLKVKFRTSRVRSCLSSLPKSTTDVYHTVSDLGQQSLQILGLLSEHLQKFAHTYQRSFEELVKKDLALFEERRLQDILLCRVQAPEFSIKDMDFVSEWKLRLKEVQEKRQLYLQKMNSVLDSFWMTYRSEVAAEVTERERFETKLQEVCRGKPVDTSAVDAFLSTELQLQTNLLQKRKNVLKAFTEEHESLLQELSEQDAQTQAQLQDDRSKRCTLLQGLEGAPLKTELSLIQENHKLLVHLRSVEDQLQSLNVEKEELQKAQVKADHRVSNHKEATQLLQTELQDTCAKLQEQERTIKELNTRLQQLETEANSSASVVETEKLQSKISKLDMELKSSSEKYKHEIQKLTSLLEAKEVSIRRLKETLRSQHQNDESYLEGEALHAHLVQPKGLVNLDKSRLEEEARKLKLRITELESLVTSLQAEVGKWKQRAIKMKSKTEMETKPKREQCPGLDCSPPKKLLCDSPRKRLRSPRKCLDSPVLSLLNSPKSRFFDGGSSSEILVNNCPKQFFDNSRLGTPPVCSDADGAANTKQDWLQWPVSPKEEEMCKNQ